jgi:hypothetical protein
MAECSQTVGTFRALVEARRAVPITMRVAVLVASRCELGLHEPAMDELRHDVVLVVPPPAG